MTEAEAAPVPLSDLARSLRERLGCPPVLTESAVIAAIAAAIHRAGRATETHT